MKPSAATLKKMKKSELIGLILELQNSQTVPAHTDLFEGKKLTFKRNFQNYGLMANGNKKYGFVVTGTHRTLTIKWNKYVPSGYGDNGVGGSFEVILSDRELKAIENNGFTHSVVLPMIKVACEIKTGGKSDTVTSLVAA
jgi:hypothetical protein